MTTTYLVGYYGMQNTGDDALLYASAWGAERFLNASKLILNSPLPLTVRGQGSIDSLLTEKQRFPGQNRFRQYGAALESSRIIFGGGSVLHNARDIDLKRDLMTLSGFRGHMALGVGIGPFVNSRAERSCKRFLESCHFVGVRDRESYEVANAIAPSANVHMTFDLAPSMLADESFHLHEVPRRGVAVCLCPVERVFNGDEVKERVRLKELATALDRISMFTGEPIIFVDFNGHPELGDRVIHSELASYMRPTTAIEFIGYDSNPHRVLQRMASFKTVVSMRLHASVFAYMSQTPIVSLNYHSKCKGWCEQIGLSETQQFGLENVSALGLSQVVCEGLQYGFEAPVLPIETAVHESMNNWSKSHENYECNAEDIRRYSFV